MGYIIEVKEGMIFRGKRRKSIPVVSFSVEDGEIVLLRGDEISCALLMSVIGGIERLSGGKALFYGENLSEFTDEQLSVYRRRYVGFVPGSRLISNLTVLQNITLSGDEREGVRLLGEMGLRDKLNAYEGELSQVEIMLVSLIRAAAKSPALLLISEPTSGLTDKHRVIEAINFLKGDTTVIIYSSESELLGIADRVITLGTAKRNRKS